MLDQPHIGGLDGVDDLGARKISRFFVLAISREHRVLVLEFCRASIRRQAVFRSVQIVVRRGSHVRPMRLDVGKVQHPGFVALTLDKTDRLIGHECSFGMLFLHARGKAGVAHVPSADDFARRIECRNHIIRPRIRAGVAMRAQELGIAAFFAGRRMAIVAVDLGETAAAKQRAQLRGGFDAIAFEAARVRHHVGLAGERGGEPVTAQIIAQGQFAHRQGHAIPCGAMRAHIASGVKRHA